MRRHSFFRIFATVLMIICLLAILGGLLIYSKQLEAERSRSLEAEAAQTNTDDANALKTEDNIQSEEPKAEEEPAETPAAEPTPEPTEALPEISETEESTEPETERKGLTGVSIRGDDFSEDIVDPASGYAARLKVLFENNGIEVPVQDNTWEMAGSLSQMALAGVSDEEIQNYIDAHSKYAQANNIELAVTDLRVRADLLEKTSARSDQEYLPVIMTGYYGGWGEDPEELVGQIQKILGTYDDPQDYIVAGVYPYRYHDTENYDRVMREAFGDHYLQIDSATGMSGTDLMSPDGRQAIAEAIYERLVSSGLIG